MGSFRLIKRGVLFSAEGDAVTRADLASEETLEEIVTGSGNPVAVVFGTRFITPVVVGWAALGDRITSYYRRSDHTIRNSPLAGATDNIRMLILSMRMVLCVGYVDGFSSFAAGGIQFRPILRGSISDSQHIFEIGTGDTDMFGGTDGGLGFPDRSTSTLQQLSRFVWNTGEGNTPITIIDRGAETRGVTSLSFNNFNFGGKIPPVEWQLAVTRINQLTHRVNDRYPDQWNTSGDAHRISNLPALLGQMFYFIVLDPTADSATRRRYRDQLLALPHDETTRYQVCINPYEISSIFVAQIGSVVTRKQFIDDLNSYANESPARLRVLGREFPEDRAYVYQTRYTQGILTSYASSISSRSLRGYTSVVIWHITTLVLLRLQPSNLLTGWISMMEHFQNPLPPPTRYFYTQRQIDAIRSNPPVIKIVRYSPPSNTRPNRIFRVLNVPRSDWNRVDALDAAGQVIFEETTPRQFLREFDFLTTFGSTMNPVHALREMLTNPDWGEGIDESRLDNGSFLVSATICKTEQLDYCAVHDKIGSISKLATGVTDYIDGIVYYEAATDKVRLKLIRQDYTLSNIPSFDESNMTDVSNYQRQHSNELVNSVTIKYHDAAKGSTETVTVHDIEASNRIGQVVAATLNYDGCATRQAAVRVSERELTSLSKAVISFTARVDPGEVIGLGDPVLVSYRDLGLARVVMRVSKIDYGDGLTGGITLHLIQDVFADLATFDDLVGEEQLPDETPVLIDLQEDVKFLESGDFDLENLSDDDGNPIIIDPQGRYIKGGVRYSSLVTDQTAITLAGQPVQVSIGILLDEIPTLSSNPREQSLTFYVRGPVIRSNYLRINNEIMRIKQSKKLTDDIAQYTIDRRAQQDTVCPPTPHLPGSDVWFLDQLWVNKETWDGNPVVSIVQQGVYIDRELVTPNINFINRHILPWPPVFATVNDKFTPNVRVDGAITVIWGSLVKYPGQATTIRLMNGDQEIFNQQFLPPLQTFRIGTDVINLTGQHNLRLYVGSAYTNLNSWQSWEFNIDWSSTVRQRTGWSYRWDKDWGGGDASGWGFDWDQTWGN